MLLRERLSGVRIAGVIALCVALVSVTASRATGETMDIASQAPQEFTARIPTEYLERTMSLYGRKALSKAEVRSAMRAATSAGVDAFPVRAPMLAMVEYARATSGSDVGTRVDKKVVRRGWRVPMQAVALPTDLVRRIAGTSVANVLDDGAIAMGATSARLRNSKVGDVVTVLDRGNRRKSFVVGVIVPDVFTGEGDLLISDDTALRLGVRSIRRVTFIGFNDESQVRRSLSRRGIEIGAMYRLSHSWGRKNPDTSLGLAKVKEMFGEFEYQKVNGKGVLVDSRWRSRSIAHRITYSDVQLNHNCHVRIVDAIQKALTEIREKV